MERRVAKEVVDFCNALVGTWKVNRRTYGIDIGFPERQTENEVLEISSDETATSTTRRYYRWTVKAPETAQAPTMIMEVIPRDDRKEDDFEFRSDGLASCTHQQTSTSAGGDASGETG